MEILRSAGAAPGRSQGTAFGEFVWAVATDRAASATIEEQAQNPGCSDPIRAASSRLSA